MKTLIDRLNEELSNDSYFLDENGSILKDKAIPIIQFVDDNESATKSDFIAYFNDLINEVN